MDTINGLTDIKGALKYSVSRWDTFLLLSILMAGLFIAGSSSSTTSSTTSSTSGTYNPGASCLSVIGLLFLGYIPLFIKGIADGDSEMRQVNAKDLIVNAIAVFVIMFVWVIIMILPIFGIGQAGLPSSILGILALIWFIITFGYVVSGGVGYVLHGRASESFNPNNILSVWGRNVKDTAIVVGIIIGISIIAYVIGFVYVVIIAALYLVNVLPFVVYVLLYYVGLCPLATIATLSCVYLFTKFYMKNSGESAVRELKYDGVGKEVS